jgi:hypothetical protein
MYTTDAPLSLIPLVASLTTLFLAGVIFLIMVSIRRRIGTSILAGGFRKSLIGIFAILSGLALHVFTVIFPEQTAIYSPFILIALYTFILVGLLSIVTGYKQIVDKLESLSH